MSQKLLFVFNPHSGRGLIQDHLLDIVNTMVRADYEVTIYPTQKRGDATRIVQEKGAGYDLIVCSGGDGTLDETMNGMAFLDPKPPIGYIPAGSTNDFAESLGLPKNMVDAAQVAVSGKPFLCDMGWFCGEHFVYVAAFGMFTEVSYETPQEIKNVLGHAAYILEGIRHLQSIPSFYMKAEHDGETFEGEFIYGMVTNSESVGGFKGMTGPDVKLNDGVFEVTMVRTPKNALELNEIIRCLTNPKTESNMVYIFKTASMHLTFEQEVAWTLDGEFGGKHREINIRNLHDYVEILVPDK